MVDMYAAIDTEQNVISFHDEKRVVEKYISEFKRYNNADLYLCKIKKKSKYKLKYKEDLYLVRYKNTYL